MTSLTMRIRNGTFVVGIAGALSFGVTSASATASDGAARRECDVYTSSAEICAQICWMSGYPEWAWFSSDGCCYCLW